MKWEIQGTVEGGDLDVFAIDETLGNYRVCMLDCDDDTVSDHDHMMNAKLIAAAPDLLAALEFLEPHLSVLSIHEYERVKIRNAIAKAKGA